MVSDIGAIFAALMTMDSFEIRNALRSDATWVIGLITLLIGGYIVARIYRAAPFIEQNLEKAIMVGSYLAIAFIIFWGVVDRFVFSSQKPWSTTIPPLLFMVMAWYGASYNIRKRTHLSFSEFRTKMPRRGQHLCLWLDGILWFGFAWILFVTTARQTALSASNFAIVLGTDNTMLWWFLITAPVAAVLMAGRAIQNIMDDVENWRLGEPLIKQAVIGGDV